MDLRINFFAPLKNYGAYALFFSLRSKIMEVSQNTKLKIGVMGSAGRDKKLPEKLLEKAREIGREIAHCDCILITGACIGLPHEAARGATKEGGLAIGISPASSLKEHTEPPLSYPAPFENMVHIYTGFGREGRNVVSIRSADAVILLAGQTGTLNEFSIAYQLGKVIGILKGVGGISEKIPEIAGYMKKKTGAVIVLDSEPKELLRKILRVLKKRFTQITPY